MIPADADLLDQFNECMASPPVKIKLRVLSYLEGNVSNGISERTVERIGGGQMGSRRAVRQK